MNRSHASTFSWHLATSLATAASQLLNVAVCSRHGGVAMLGTYAWCQSIALAIMAFTRLPLRSVHVCDVDDEVEPADSLTLCLTTAGIGILLVFLAAFSTFFPTPNAWTTTILAVTFGIESISEVIYGVLDHRGRSVLAARAALLRTLVTSATFIAGLILTGSLLAASLLRLSGMIVVLAGIDFPTLVCTEKTMQPFLPRWNTRSLLALVHKAGTLGLTSGVCALDNSLPRYLLASWHGPGVLGAFTAIAQTATAGMLVVQAFTTTSVPRLSQLYRNNSSECLTYLLTTLLLAAGLGATITATFFLAGHPLLLAVFGETAAREHSVLWVFSATTALQLLAVTSGMAIRIANQVWLMFKVRCIALCITVAVGALLIPPLGCTGAALTMLISTALVTGISLYKAHTLFTHPRRAGTVLTAQRCSLLNPAA